MLEWPRNRGLPAAAIAAATYERSQLSGRGYCGCNVRTIAAFPPPLRRDGQPLIARSAQFV